MLNTHNAYQYDRFLIVGHENSVTVMFHVLVYISYPMVEYMDCVMTGLVWRKDQPLSISTCRKTLHFLSHKKQHSIAQSYGMNGNSEYGKNVSIDCKDHTVKQRHST